MDTARLQESGQSSGHAVCTVVRPQESGGLMSSAAGAISFRAMRRVYDDGMASFQQRVIGALRLKSATYEEVEHDTSATMQAAAIVLVVSLTNSVSWYFVMWDAGSILRGALLSLLAWVIGALFLWQIGTRLLPGKKTEADLGQLLRTVGFAQAPGIFGLLAIVPLVGLFVPFIVAFWIIAATFVAVRQALDYDDTFRAIMVCLLAWIVSALTYMVLGIGSSRVV